MSDFTLLEKLHIAARCGDVLAKEAADRIEAQQCQEQYAAEQVSKLERRIDELSEMRDRLIKRTGELTGEKNTDLLRAELAERQRDAAMEFLRIVAAGKLQKVGGVLVPFSHYAQTELNRIRQMGEGES